MKKPHVKLAGIFAGLLVVGFLLWFVFGKGVGKDCSSDWDCFGFGTFCVQTRGRPFRYCTTTCDGDSDCPDRFRCLRRPMFDHQDLSVKIDNICVPSVETGK
jgi:hypothetical protein